MTVKCKRCISRSNCGEASCVQCNIANSEPNSEEASCVQCNIAVLRKLVVSSVTYQTVHPLGWLWGHVSRDSIGESSHKCLGILFNGLPRPAHDYHCIKIQQSV